MERASAPAKRSNSRNIKAIAERGRKQPLIIRTLDVGGDKPLAYLPIPKEDNPFLGEREFASDSTGLKSFARNFAHSFAHRNSARSGSCSR